MREMRSQTRDVATRQAAENWEIITDTQIRFLLEV